MDIFASEPKIIDQEELDRIANNTLEAWRTDFQEKQKEREEKRQYPKPPLWVLTREETKPTNAFSNDIEIEKVQDSFLKASSLFWEETKEKFYFIDEVKKTVIRFTPGKDELKTAEVIVDGNGPQFIIPMIGNNYEFLVSIGANLYKMEWNGSSKKVSYLKLMSEQNTSYSSSCAAKVGPIGRVAILCVMIDSQAEVDYPGSNFVGSFVKMYEAPDTFPCVLNDSSHRWKDLAFNCDSTKLYVIDTDLEDIYVFPYIVQKGILVDSSTKVDWSQSMQVSPSCLTCDVKDHLWVGCSQIAYIVEFDPIQKAVIRKISLDKSCIDVTSITFGHSNRDVLYVTTVNSAEQDSEDEQDFTRRSIGASSLFRIWNLGARSIAQNRFRLFEEERGGEEGEAN